MNRHHILAIVTGIAILCFARGPIDAQSTRDAEAAFKAAQQQEEVRGDLKGAIEAYKKIAAGSDKALAAKALLRMGECYQRLGDTQAAAIFEQLVREYRQQPEAAEAQARLIAMRPPTSRSGARRDWVGWTTHDFPMAVSPDGRFVAFDDGGVSLHDMETGADHVLVKRTDREGPDDDASFSRDGQKLAYTWYKDTGEELDVVSVRNPSTPQVLLSTDTDGGEPKDWTSDGRSILIVTGYKNGSSIQLGLVSAQQGKIRVLKSVDRPGDIGAARLSRDDKYVAFDTRAGGGTPSNVFLISLDGTRETPVVQDRWDEHVVGWSRDNSRLLYTSDRSGSNVLYAQRIVDGRPEGQAEILTNVLDHTDAIGVTTAGALYYLADRTRSPAKVRIASMDPTTGRVVSALADVGNSNGTGSDTAADFSADGTLLAYVANSSPVGSRFASDHKLVVQNIETGARTEARLTMRIVRELCWAPNGEYLIAVGFNRTSGPDSGLWRVDPRTGAASLVASGDPSTVGFRFAFFSPDSATVYYSRLDTSSKQIAVFAHDMGTGADRELFRGPADDATGPHALGVSPDWKTVYYRKTISGVAPYQESAFVARDLATGTERELVRRNLGGVTVAPDGKYIATASNDAATKSRSVVLVPTDGSAARELMRIDLPKDFPSQVIPLSIYTFSPDSQYLIVERTFGATRADRREWWWVPIDGHVPPALLDVGPVAGLRVNRDNRRIALLTPGGTAWNTVELHVLEHFLPEDK